MEELAAEDSRHRELQAGGILAVGHQLDEEVDVGLAILVCTPVWTFVIYAYRTRNLRLMPSSDMGTWGCGWAGDAPGDRYLGRIKVGVMPEVGPNTYRARATGYITPVLDG